MMFLAQVYAPDDDDEGGTRVIKETCYHRTIYIFLCITPLCNKKNSNENFCVLRCQLARKNEFYPPIDPPEDPDWKKDLVVTKFTKVCMVCGCLGTKLCGGCRKVNYCTKDHQVLHWKNGHKMLCKECKFLLLIPLFTCLLYFSVLILAVCVEGEDSMFTLPGNIFQLLFIYVPIKKNIFSIQIQNMKSSLKMKKLSHKLVNFQHQMKQSSKSLRKFSKLKILLFKMMNPLMSHWKNQLRTLKRTKCF